MSDATIRIGIDSGDAKRGADQVNSSLKSVKDNARATTTETDKLGKSFKGLSAEALIAVKAFTGLSAVLAVHKVIQYSDAYKQLQGRLKVVTDGTKAYLQAEKEVYDISQRTRQGLRGVGDLYTRLGMAAQNNATLHRNLGKTVEAVATSFAITGESAAAAQGAIVQFAQGLATNFSAAGQEIRSIQEQAPRLAKAIADGLNQLDPALKATAGNLNKLGTQGKLTADLVVVALKSQLPVLQRELEKIPKTVGQAISQLDNAFLRFIGQSDLVNAGTSSLAASLGVVAENFDDVATAATAAAAIFAARYAGPIIRERAALLASEIQYQRAVLTGNAVTLDSVEAARQRAAADAFATRETLAATQATVRASETRIATLQAEQAQIARHITLLRTEAEALALSGLPKNNRALQDRLEIHRDLNASQGRLLTTTRSLTAAEAALAVEQNAVAVASGRAAVGQEALAIATANTTLAARTAAVASRALSGALALVGGPWGAAILALGAAFYYLRDAEEAAKEAAERKTEVLHDLNNIEAILEGRGKTLAEQSQQRASALIDEAQALYKVAEAELAVLRARQAGPEGAYALAKIGDTSQRDALAQQAELKRQEAEKLLADVKRGREQLDAFILKGGANVGLGDDGAIDRGTNAVKERSSALEKFNEKMRESLALARADIDASQVGAREQAIAKALTEGETAAREDYNKKLRGTADLLENERILISQRASATYDLVTQLEKENEQRDLIKQAIEDTRTPAEKLTKQLNELEAARPFAKTPEDIDAINRKMEQLREGVNPLSELFRRTAEGITDAFTDAFKSILDGKGGFKGVLKSMLNLLKETIARMATIAIARPIIVPIISSVGGALGIGQASIDAVTGQLGGSGGLSGASNGASLLSNIPSLTDFLSGNIGGFNGLNQLGAEYLGTGLVGQGSVTGVSLSGVGLNAGIGGLAANLMGMGTGNGLLDSGLGLAGSYGGSALASALGAGSFAGPAGIIGAFALTALAGGLMKKKPSSKLQAGQVDLTSGAFLGREGLTGSKFSQENYDTVTRLGGSAAAIGKALGAKGSVSVAASDRYGYEYSMLDDVGALFKGGDATKGRKSFKSGNDFFKNLTLDLAQSVAGELPKFVSDAIKGLDWGSTEEELQAAIKDLDFITAFDGFIKGFTEVQEPISVVDAAIAALNKTFDDTRETAERLKFPLEEISRLEEARAVALRKLATDFNASVGSNILELSNPAALAVAQEIKRYNEQMKDAVTLGADRQQVELLHQLKMKEIAEQLVSQDTERLNSIREQNQEAAKLVQQYSEISKSLGDAIFDLRTGELSTLSPLDKLNASRDQFNLTAAQAALGDSEAMQALPELGKQFLGLSLAYNASTLAFAADFDAVQRALEAAKATAERQVSIQQAIVDSTQQEISVLEAGFSAVVSALGGFLTSSTAKAGYNDAGRSLSEAAGNGLSVGQTESIARAVLGGYTGPSGNGQLNALIQQKGLGSQYVAALTASGANMTGYATGGYPAHGQPYVAGEHGPEIIANPGSAMVIPFQQNAMVIQSIMESNQHQQAQVRIMQAGFARLIELAEDNNDALRTASLNSSLEARRKAV